jgi:hypothetical protein
MAMRSRLTKTILSWFWTVIFISTVHGQQNELAKLWEVSIPATDKITTDNKGNIFVTDKQGYLFQFNAKGASINHLSTSLSAPVTRLDAFRTVNIFLFSASLQRFEILDRFLNPITKKSMEEIGVLGWVSQATPGNNNSLWIYDETDLNLKKINLTNNELLQAQAINILTQKNNLEIIQLIERNNLLFLQLANDGIYIFDNQANFIEKIAVLGNIAVVIDGEFIYSLFQDQLKKTNFLTKETEFITFPQRESSNRLALSHQQIIIANDKGIVIFNRPTNF